MEGGEHNEDAPDEEVGADGAEGVAVDALFPVAHVAFQPDVVVRDCDGAGSVRVAPEWGDGVAWDGDDALDALLLVVVRGGVDIDLAPLGRSVRLFAS